MALPQATVSNRDRLEAPTRNQLAWRLGYPARRTVSIAVAAAWLLVVLSDFAYVAQYGLSTPQWDDWSIVPYATGQEPITLQWLWQFEADHRIPLPKLIFVGIFRLFGQDVRAIMFLNVLLLGLAAALGILAVRRLSGRTSITDAVIPLTLAGIANYSNLVSANQIHYISSSALFCFVAYLLLSTEEWFSLPRVALLGISGVCLLLTGTTGLALALPLLAVLPLAVWLQRRRPDRGIRMARWLAGALALALAAGVLAYDVFSDRPVSPVSGPASSIQQLLTGIAEFAAVSFAAPPLTFSAPTSVPDGLPSLLAVYFSPDWVYRTWRLRAAVVIAAAAIAVLRIVWPVVRRRAKAGVALGPLGCLAGVGALALAIGYARGSSLEQRYIVLGATAVFGIYLCLRLQRHWTATLAAWALLVTSLVLLPWNVYQSLSFGNARRAFEAGLIGDIQAGVPVDLLGTRYYQQLWGDPALASTAIREMRDDHVGPFANQELQLNDATPVVASEKTLSLQPTSVHNMMQVGDYWEGTGSDSFLVYDVKQTNLAGVRLTYNLANPTQRPAYFQLAWSRTPDGGFDPTSKGNTFVVWGAPTTNQQAQVVAWIGDSVDMLRVTPDTQASSFKLNSLVLLLSQ